MVAFKDFRDPEIPFSTARRGVHDGFATVLRAPNSFRDAAQYFDVTPTAIKQWVRRRWVPVFHWRQLEQLCIDCSRPERLQTFVAWGFECGLKARKEVTLKWTDAEASKCVKILRRFAAKMRVKSEYREEAAHEAFYRMMEAGVRDLNYGFTVIASDRFKFRKSLAIPIDDVEEIVDRLNPVSITPERIAISADILAHVVAASERLSQNRRVVFQMMIAGNDDAHIARVMGVQERYIYSLRYVIRRQLKEFLAAEISGEDLEAA